MNENLNSKCQDGYKKSCFISLETNSHMVNTVDANVNPIGQMIWKIFAGTGPNDTPIPICYDFCSYVRGLN